MPTGSPGRIDPVLTTSGVAPTAIPYAVRPRQSAPNSASAQLTVRRKVARSSHGGRCGLTRRSAGARWRPGRCERSPDQVVAVKVKVAFAVRPWSVFEAPLGSVTL